MTTDKPRFINPDPPERSRTYLYLNPGDTANPFRIEFRNVAAICVRPGGSHRLEMVDGTKAVVLPGFVAVLLEVDSWSF